MIAACVATAPAQNTARPAASGSPSGKTVNAKIEQVFAFNNQMPTGVTVSQSGRIFVNYPRWEDKVVFTVAELKDGREIPFPDANVNKLDLQNVENTFVSVQSVVVDPRDRLWILDTGSINLLPIVSKNAPKLVCVDLTTNKIIKTIRFDDSEAVLHSTYLNDIRFDLRKGAEGVAYITDSSASGPNAIIVVDLASGKSRRVLNGHNSVSPEPLFTVTVEGKDFKQRMPDQPPMHIRLGADGIAIGADGARLYYCPLASRKLYSVSTDALLNPKLSETELAKAVRDEGEKPAADGLESDAEGRIYSTDYEFNAIARRAASGGKFETIVQDPRMLWSDTLSVASDGYLYFTANQLHRQAGYNNGRDLRQKPYNLFRVRLDATPIRLK
ncbi:MAG: gluconolaconase [Pyrinomonadaceae bacterium]|nr:gluconolaconase [Pyrinomonadaceae bacterium]